MTVVAPAARKSRRRSGIGRSIIGAGAFFVFAPPADRSGVNLSDAGLRRAGQPGNIEIC
jgi:hypothetical protein